MTNRPPAIALTGLSPPDRIQVNTPTDSRRTAFSPTDTEKFQIPPSFDPHAFVPGWACLQWTTAKKGRSINNTIKSIG
jgi:hypothetical protein